MKNTKSTKHALLTSVMALFLCVTMLLGTTFAWFTDTVTSGVNTIVAGNLDIEVQYSTDGTSWADLEGTRSLFSDNLWEPGHTEVVYLKITNAGTLDLNYKVLVTPVSESGGVNVNGQSFKLSDYLVFGTTDPARTGTTYTRDEARAAVGTTTGLNVNNLTKIGTMVGKTDAATDVQYLALVVYMPENVGNEANYKTGTAAPTIELGIKVIATQKTAEQDSFGTDYDTGAVTDSFYTVGAYYNYFPQIAVTQPVAATGATDITASGKLNSTDTVDTTLATVSVPEGAVAEGVTALNFSVKPVEPSNSDAQIVIRNETANGREAANFDVKVSGIKSDNTTPIPVKLFVGKGLSGVKVFHNGNEISADYDPATGYVSFNTTGFSDFTVSYDPAVAAIDDQTCGSLASAIAAAEAGDTIKLLKDIEVSVSAAAKVAFTLDKNVTLNGNGLTIKVKGDSSGDTYAILATAGGKIQNLNLKVTGVERAIRLEGTAPYTISSTKITGTGVGIHVKGAAEVTLDKIDVTINAEPSFNAHKRTGVMVGAAANVTLSNSNVTVTASDKSEEYTNTWGKGLYVGTDAKGHLTVDNTNVNADFAIAIDGSSDSSNLNSITINSGNFTGKAGSPSGYSYKEVIIKGGTFNDFGFAANTFYNTTNPIARMIITGGTFSSDPSDYVANGYGAINEGNVYKVIAGNFAKNEADLDTMLTTGATVYLVNDMTLANSHTIPENATIDCLGHKVTVSSLGAFSGKNFTIKNGILEKGSAWGFASGSCTLENCVFNGIGPYIVPSTGVDIVVKGCTFNGAMLQICWPEGEEKDPTKHTTTITGNTFNCTSTDSYNHVIALNAGAFINYSKVEVANNTFNNSGTPAFGVYYLSDSVDSRGGISINYHDNEETNITVGYRDQVGTYQKVTENNAIYAIYESGRKVLAKVTADYSGETFEIPNDVAAIGDWAFSSANVKKVMVPASVTDLGRGFDTSTVEEVILSEGLTTISSRAFRKTPNLKTLVIPSTVTTIVENAFQQSGITKIVIPESVVSIEFGAFRDCPNLKTVTIQGNPTIANYAFRACPELTHVYLNGDDVKFGEGISMVFSTQENNNNNSKITIHVVNETVKARVEAIKGKGTPYNIELTSAT